MATQDEAEQALIDGIQVLAKKAESGGSYSHSEGYARAALHLAETYAWLRSPHQPHSGTVNQKS